MITEEIKTAKQAHLQLNHCDCEGTPALPWNYCDPCTEARDFLNSLMEPEEVPEQDYDESRD